MADDALAELTPVLDELRGDDAQLKAWFDRELDDLRRKKGPWLLDDLDTPERLRGLLDQVEPALREVAAVVSERARPARSSVGRKSALITGRCGAAMRGLSSVPADRPGIGARLASSGRWLPGGRKRPMKRIRV